MLKPTGVPPLGLYSHASAVSEGARLVFVAGQLAVGPDGAVVGEGDFPTQMRQVLDNLLAVLRHAGMDARNVAKFTTYVTGAELIGPFYETREQLFRDWYPDGGYPPNTLLVVSRLVRPEFMIEIEAIAAGTAS